MAILDGSADEYGLVYSDPRLPALGQRVMLPPHLAKEAAADHGAELFEAHAYEAHRIALGVPRGGLDFIYGDAFPHETDMDQLNGIDFAKGCFVGQEVVSRIEHRGTARKPHRTVTAEPFPTPACGYAATGRSGAPLARRQPRPGAATPDRAADARAAGIPSPRGPW